MIPGYAYESRGKKRGNTVFSDHVDRLDMRVKAIQCGRHPPAISNKFLHFFFVFACHARPSLRNPMSLIVLPSRPLMAKQYGLCTETLWGSECGLAAQTTAVLCGVGSRAQQGVGQQWDF